MPRLSSTLKLVAPAMEETLVRSTSTPTILDLLEAHASSTLLTTSRARSLLSMSAKTVLGLHLLLVRVVKTNAGLLVTLVTTSLTTITSEEPIR